MHARILRLIVIVWLMVSPLNVTPVVATSAAGAAAKPIELLSPIELRPPLKPLAAGNPQTITLEITPTILIANSGATAVVTATVIDPESTPVPGVHLNGFTSPGTLGGVSGLSVTRGGTGQDVGTWTAGAVIGSGTIEIGNGVVSGTASIRLAAGALTTVTVVPSTTTVTVGLTTTFAANGTDAFGNAVAITPTWSASGGSIDATGVFTAQTSVASGRRITATADTISGTAIVTVIAGPLSSIVITPTSATITAGNVLTFTASGHDQYGNVAVFTPTWSTNGGTIDQTGVYTAQAAVASGRLVTVSHNTVYTTALVNITAGPLMSITVSPNPANVVAGATQVFTATGYDMHNNVVPITPTWTTNGGSINPGSGLFTAQITVTTGRLVTATYNAVSGTASVNILAAPLSSITVSPTNATVVANTTQVFTATGYDIYNNAVPITPTWTTNGGSINPSSGLFTAQITATTGRLVTATYNVVSGTASVNILAGPLNSITVLPPSANVVASTTQLFTANGFDQFGNAVPITPTWTTNGGSINPGSGLFTAQITATTGRLVTATHNAVSGTASVNILAAPLSTIVVSPPSANVVASTTQVFTANGFDQFGNAVPITPTWTTNGGSINASGLFTAQLTVAAGRLVTATQGIISRTASVNVIAGPLSSIIVSPTNANVVANTTQVFTATGYDMYNNVVPITPTWTTNGGSINPSSGLFTAQITATTGRLVTATYNAVSGTASVNILAGPLNSITVSPPSADVVAGTTRSFTANGFDQFGNAVPITPTWTTNGGSINASGLFTAQLTVAAGRLVTATQGIISRTASVNIVAGPLNQIIVAPGAVTLTVATTQTFSASGFDQFGNGVPITPTWTTNGGSINASGVFTAQNVVASGRRVTATQGITTGFALVNLRPGAPYTLTVQPPTAVISAGQRITYTALATDTFGNAIGNVTGSTTFSITPASGGNFAANVVTPTVKNTWLVTGTNGSAVDTATLTITAGAFNRLTIENAPAGLGSPVNVVTLNIYNTLTVYAVAYDVYNNLIGAQSSTWTGTGVVAGNLAPTAGISTTFTPVVSGTGTIRAASGSITDTTGTITVQAPLLRISKTASPDPLTPGSPLQYTIVYTNVGNATAQNVIITETYPLSTSFFSAFPITPTFGNNVWSIGTLAVNDPHSIAVFMTTTNQMPVGTVLTNTVRMGAAKVATTIYTATTPVNALPDLSVSVIDSPDPVRPGDLLVYTIQYRNDGTAPVTNVRITETYPAYVSFDSATPSPSSGNNVWLIGTLNGQGGNGIITVHVRVNSPLTDTTILNNRVVVAAQEAPPYTTTQQTLIVAPELQLAKLAQPVTPTANSLLTYTLLYSNTGSSYAANTVISDALPGNTSFVQCQPIGCGENSGIVTWNLGQVNQQIVEAVTVTVRIANNLPDGTVITNTARITSTDQVSDTAALITTITSAPDVTLSKSDGITEIAANQITTYTLTYANIGTAPAATVVITDYIPDHTTLIGCSACVGAGAGVYSFAVGTVKAGEIGTATLSVRLAPTLPAGLRVITNTATISTATTGDRPTSNIAQDVNDISTRPVLDLGVDYDPVTPYPGKIITYTLYYTNVSAMDTISVMLTVARPSWVTITPLGWTQDITTHVRWIGDLAVGQSGAVTYVVTLPLTYTQDMSAFTLVFTIQDGGPGGLPIARQSRTVVIGVPDLSIAQVIVPPTIAAGQKFTATLVISNSGLGRACNPKAVSCGGFYVDAFIDPATPPPSYPFQRYGDPFTGVPPISANSAITVVMPNLMFAPTQRPILYFKIDNFNCSINDPCLPSGSQGGLVPEYDETNNVSGPITLTSYSVRLPVVLKSGP